MADIQQDNLDKLIDNENIEGINNYFKKKSPKDQKDILLRQVSLQTSSYPLSYAIFKKKYLSFKEILDIQTKHRIDINQKDDAGMTFLHYAVQSKDSRFIVLILSQPSIDISIPDNDGQTPFVYFLRFHDEPTIVECINAFLKASPTILNQRIPSGKFKGDFPLNVAFSNQRSCGILIETSLSKGALPDVSNFSNDAPLLHAVGKNRLDLVLLLIKYGASIYVENNAGHSPLTSAPKADSKIAAAIALVDSIHHEMRKEFSLCLQYDLPRMIGICLLTDISSAQRLRSMTALGVAASFVENFAEVATRAVADFAETREAFDLLYHNVSGELPAPEKKVDVKSIELLGESISSQHHFGLTLYGDVLRARYKNCLVALQFIRFSNDSDAEDLYNFTQETLVPLVHDNVVRMIASSQQESSLWVVTEYCERGSLFDVLQGPKLSWSFVSGIAIDIAEGLVFLHENDVVVGILNSVRIFITLDGRAKIAEVGYHNIVPHEPTPYLVHPEIAYMAPEHISEEPVFDSEGDKYSYGMICWEMILRLITGEHIIPYYSDEEAFTNETDGIVKKKILAGNIPTIATRENAQVFTAPPKLGKIYKNICQQKPSLRWGFDKILKEWKEFDEENENDPKRWKNCLQTDGELCPGEYANKKFKLVQATEVELANSD
ncbi:receptor protein serine/threonine kinase [Entamoeba marina]